MPTNKRDDVAAFLGEYPAGVREMAIELRQRVLTSLPGADETLDRQGRVVGYGFGSGYKDLICTIIPSKTGVKLGIVNGATLSDPDGLLEGAGKRHRYVKLATQSDVQRPAVTRLLKAALAAWTASSPDRSAGKGPQPRSGAKSKTES